MSKDYSLYFYEKMPDENFLVDIFEKRFNEPRPLFSTHWHEHMQFFYFIKGNALMSCSSKRFRVGPGDLVVVNSNEMHYGENLGTDLYYYIFRIDLSFLSSSKPDSCQTKFIAPLAKNLIIFKNKVSNDPEVNSCVNNIIDEFNSKNFGYELAIKSQVFSLLVLLLRGYTDKIFSPKEYSLRLDKIKRFHNIVEYIDKNYTEKINVSQMAKMANLSEQHFCRMFKNTMGISAIEYINQLRIEKATILLEESSLNITELAMECGFNDINYFCRLFKKLKKITPSQLRKSQSV